ncbi:hypothetical protein [Butyrivibrio sp. WCE2006]|uniref:hypothetical protein n=1 Tax=Butyrivibrio sp. WCE2006 TaxID=1410611 RepID=UPI0005D1EF25|nr:hypothetical protein [Butyrivibrio sp. WCE2006]
MRDSFVTTNDNLYLFNIDDHVSELADFFDIFNDERYREFRAISYVASPEFFCTHTNHFCEVETIIGINDSETCSTISKGIMQNWEFSGIDFFNSCDDEMKEKIANDRVKLRFCKTGVTAHSKIYLLHGVSDGVDNYLTIIGSCNMTNNGFGIGARQFEDGCISRDAKVYNDYLNRYQAIYLNTIDAVPEGCKRLWKKENRLADLAEEADIKTEHLDNNREDMSITTESIRELTELSHKDTDEARRAERIVELIKTSTNNAKNKIRTVKSKSELEANRHEFTKLRVQKVSVGDDPAPRTELIYHSESNNLYATRPGIDKDAIIFNEKLSSDDIRDELEKLVSFTRCYERNVADNNSDVGKKIWEVFLHAYQSPFFWKYRVGMKKYFNGTEEMLAKIPNILFISGQSSSGKTPLLSAINQLLQNGAYNIPQWKSYRDYDGKSYMTNRMQENNLFPVMIDEVEKDFLSGGKCRWYGEAWIKEVSNNLGSGLKPYMMMASNKNIELSSPLQTRINYISIDEKIALSSEERTILSDIINSMNNRLFKDFCARALEKENIYDVKYDSKFMPDFAGPARDIFLEYFEEVQMEIPDNFPMSPINDYAIKGIQMWKDAFSDQTISEAFTYKGESNELIVNRELLSRKQYSRKERDLLRFLSESVKKSGNANENQYLHRDAEAFFEWIGVKNPYIDNMVVSEDEDICVKDTRKLRGIRAWIARLTKSV